MKNSYNDTTYRKFVKPYCERCKITYDKTRKYGSLSIHHKDGNHRNNKVKNLMTLCRRCHSYIHGELRSKYRTNLIIFGIKRKYKYDIKLIMNR